MYPVRFVNYVTSLYPPPPAPSKGDRKKEKIQIMSSFGEAVPESVEGDALSLSKGATEAEINIFYW
jgi:hypothetical protein